MASQLQNFLSQLVGAVLYLTVTNNRSVPNVGNENVVHVITVILTLCKSHMSTEQWHHCRVWVLREQQLKADAEPAGLSSQTVLMMVMMRPCHQKVCVRWAAWMAGSSLLNICSVVLTLWYLICSIWRLLQPSEHDERKAHRRCLCLSNTQLNTFCQYSWDGRSRTG